jgi:hypothetical protein
MPLLQKSDLNDDKYKYSWTAFKGDDPKITGSADSKLLNKKEGYEVLLFYK